VSVAVRAGRTGKVEMAAKGTVLRLVRRAGNDDAASLLGAALEHSDIEEVELARADRSSLIRTYTNRMSSLAENGISAPGAEEAVRRLEASEHEALQLFTFRDLANAYVGITDAAVTRLIAALVLPTRLDQH
jgi:hypothetical protein